MDFFVAVQVERLFRIIHFLVGTVGFAQVMTLFTPPLRRSLSSGKALSTPSKSVNTTGLENIFNSIITPLWIANHLLVLTLRLPHYVYLTSNDSIVINLLHSD